MRGYFRLLVELFTAMLLFGALQKLLFLICYWPLAVDLSLQELWGVFRYGVLLDISTAGYLLVLPWVVGLLCLIFGVRVGKGGSSAWRIVLRCYLAVVALAMALVGAMDLKLYEHWGYRIDATLLPYLSTPSEAAASLSAVDILSWVFLVLLTLFGALWLFWRATRTVHLERVARGAQRYVAVAVWVVVGGVLFVGIRGGVSESVANVSKVYFCSTEFANHAAVNPLFSLLSSVGKAERYGDMYRFFDEWEAERLFHGAVTADQERCLGSSGSLISGHLLRTRLIRRSRPEPNIVVIIAEGFTRGILEHDVDGRAVMPRLRQIASEGLDFSAAYASGSRTDRGVVSVLSGFPAQPQVSVMKIPSKSRSLPSLARSLGREGYDSFFVYGGDLDFMNMSSYLYSTGWQELLWGDVISRRVRGLGPTRDGAEHSKSQWGWRDEAMAVLFSDEVIARCAQGDEPFVGTWLTLSSHKPFDVGRDYGFSDPMLNSMAYADDAVGECVALLRRSVAWDNLLVVIVADHTYGAFHDGTALSAPERFHIPLIMTGGALSRRGVVSSPVAQHDVAATVLGALDLEYGDYVFSRDIFGRSYRPYAYYTFNDGFGVVTSARSVAYDNRRGQITSGSDPDGSLTALGKTLLQHSHTTLERL